MKFTFLGTGTSQGVPVISCRCEVCQSLDRRDKRLRTSGLLQSDTTTLVFDTGPDFRQQMLRQQVDVLDAVVFTHSHKDHVAGMDDVRAYNFFLKRSMHIYADPFTLDRLKVEFHYIFEGDYPGVPRVVLHKITDEKFQVGDISLQPVPVMHKDMPVLGFRSANFAYVTDANYISPTSMERLMGLDILVLNALRLKAHYSHFNLDEAIEIIETLKPRKAFLTHISHQMGMHERVNAYLPEHIELAYDGLELFF